MSERLSTIWVKAVDVGAVEPGQTPFGAYFDDNNNAIRLVPVSNGTIKNVRLGMDATNQRRIVQFSVAGHYQTSALGVESDRLITYFIPVNAESLAAVIQDGNRGTHVIDGGGWHLK